MAENNKVVIEREELLSRGWKMIGLPLGQLTQQTFQKGEKLIVWDAETKEIIKGSLGEE